MMGLVVLWSFVVSLWVVWPWLFFLGWCGRGVGVRWRLRRVDSGGAGPVVVWPGWHFTLLELGVVGASCSVGSSLGFVSHRGVACLRFWSSVFRGSFGLLLRCNLA